MYVVWSEATVSHYLICCGESCTGAVGGISFIRRQPVKYVNITILLLKLKIDAHSF